MTRRIVYTAALVAFVAGESKVLLVRVDVMLYFGKASLPRTL